MISSAFPIVRVAEIASKEDGAIAIGPFGSSMKADLYVDEGVPVIRGNNIGSGRSISGPFVYVTEETAARLRRSVLVQGDIFFPHRGAIGEVGIIGTCLSSSALMSSSLMRLRVDLTLADPNFVFWFFKSRDGRAEILGYVSTVGTPGIGQPLTSLRAMRLPLPPLDEQREIAAVLGALDDKIEVNRRTAATLEAMARALYRSWFVDFDPVRARAEGRSPAFMDPDTADLFPDRLTDEDIPEGWVMTTIGDVGEVVGGSTPSTKQAAYWDGGTHPWATPKDLSSLGQPVLSDTERKITDAGLAQIGSGLSPAGTLLLSSRAPIGYLAVATRPVAVNQGFIAIRETDRISGIEAFFWCAANMETIKANANGSTFQEISKKNFRPLPYVPYVLAPPAIRAAFNRDAGVLFERMKALCAENQTLATLRETLLPRLMSGDLRVGAAEALVGEVA